MEVDGIIIRLPLLDQETKLSKVLSALEDSECHGVGIVDGKNQLAGVIDDRLLRGFREDAELTKAKALAVKTMAFDPAQNSAEDAIEFFLNSHSRVLPVVRNGKPAGCISRPGVLSLLEGKQAVKGRKVSEFMHAHVTAGEKQSIAQAISRMRDANAYHLLVTDDAGRLAGMLSAYDIACKVTPHYKAKFHHDRAPVPETAVESESVSSVMSPNVLSIAPSAPLEEAARMMRENNVSALAVVENAKPVGILTVTGVLHCCLVHEGGRVEVLGLRDDEKAMKESLIGECTAFLDKQGKKLADANLLTLHVKSKQEGAKRRYAVRARLFVGGKVISASTPDSATHKNVWDAHLATKEVLEELSRQASDHVHRKMGLNTIRRGEPQSDE